MQQSLKTITISRYWLQYLLIILCFIPSISAWSEEDPLNTANESFSWGIDETFNSSTVNDPYWFDLSRHVHASDKTIFDPYFRSEDQIDMCISYDICKYIYDDSIDAYIKTACCINIEDCITAEIYTENGINYYRYPDNIESHISDGFLIKRYYQNMMNAGHIECADFKTIDDSSGDNPDVFGINGTASAGHTDLNAVYSGYVTLDGESKKALMANQDYGFDIDSVCGEGGSGGLSNAIGWGNIDDISGENMKIFDVFFYTLLPFIFVLLIFKIIGKVL